MSAARWLVGLMVTAAVAASAASAGDERHLLEALEADALGVVGRIGQIERLDPHSFAASLWLERALGAHAGERDEGTRLQIAWGNSASGGPPHFDEGERVFVVLVRLSTAPVWRTRIPDPMTRRRSLGIAAGGNAFARDPSTETLDRLHHFLSLDPPERAGAAGVSDLAELAATARLPLAIDATWRLGATPGLSAKLGATGEAALVRALLRDDAEPLLAPLLIRVLGKVPTDSLADRLATIAREHPDASVRKRAELARARPIDRD